MQYKKVYMPCSQQNTNINHRFHTWYVKQSFSTAHQIYKIHISLHATHWTSALSSVYMHLIIISIARVAHNMNL